MWVEEWANSKRRSRAGADPRRRLFRRCRGPSRRAERHARLLRRETAAERAKKRRQLATDRTFRRFSRKSVVNPRHLAVADMQQPGNDFLWRKAPIDATGVFL